MTKLERDMEGMVSMHELTLLYNQNIQFKLDALTDNPILQDQVKFELGIN
jgi:hypothetical protein|tara:strand:- start:536 stop:685 length:150 start_codon:yes stop_codon:yes gene_type:complete